ncbi:PREDICTED: putative fatty acyl-CoA reductase CG5065 [Wasmannia auropunctata]|uniref:putative fatty acyl-CoA reductase CG5065 n=1 Tax=Wasmannia auropunctata TaxID=64793 RepID=UPI0005ED545F|nr:PREDICTED: putative fatty acyl-CoA reductase CG5065 [Wasmannia auropunctata]
MTFRGRPKHGDINRTFEDTNRTSEGRPRVVWAYITTIKERGRGNGFLGKILIEKLLRSCPDISMMYLLIRSKKGKSPKSRLDEMFESSLYDCVKKEVPTFRKKVVPIVGDLELDDLGLSENDRNILIRKVSIIFHVAANVRFYEKLKFHILVNVSATDTVLRIAKLMPNLKAFIYVSTIYVNFCVKNIEERVYTHPINYKNIITFISSENAIEKKFAKIISQWPNTYTFTKAIAEAHLKDEGGDLPIGIFRPAIISSSASEPLVGWNDNFFGPVGLTVSIISGIQRFKLCNPDVSLNFVPVDFTGNALIASAWDVFNQWRKGKDMLIYNFVPPADAPTLGEYLYKIVNISKTYPLSGAQWYPFIIILQRKSLYKIGTWLGHWLPGLLVDIVSICMNHRPRMRKIYRKIDNNSYAQAPFLMKRKNYSRDNVEVIWNRLDERDQQLFKFQMKKFDWTKYFVDFYKGICIFLLNEGDSALEIGRIRQKRFYWIHQTFKAIFIFAILWIIWIIFMKVFT